MKEFELINLNGPTPAQLLIVEVARKRETNYFKRIFNSWYDDYNDCHGDYYDAE